MSSILDTAVPVSEVATSVNMLLYGETGVGKTVFAGSGRQGGRNDLILDIESGTLSAARSSSKANAIKITSYEQLLEVIEAIEEEPDRFEWVVVDTITKLQDLIWKHITERAVAKNPSRSPHKRELQEYGEAQSRLKEIVDALNQSEANVLWLAHADTMIDEDGNNYRMPAIHGGEGKISAWVCAQMDSVVFLKMANVKDKLVRAFFFNKKPEHYAKDRMRLFTKPQINLTLEALTNKILEEGEEPTENNDNNEKGNK